MFQNEQGRNKRNKNKTGDFYLHILKQSTQIGTLCILLLLYCIVLYCMCLLYGSIRCICRNTYLRYAQPSLSILQLPSCTSTPIMHPVTFSALDNHTDIVRDGLNNAQIHTYRCIHKLKTQIRPH
eukprot:jgi/Psemu1/245344/estExt_Genewise1.C_5750078